MALMYLFNIEANEVRETEISLYDAKQLVANGKYRFATPLERIDFVRNQKPKINLQNYLENQHLLNVFFCSKTGTKDGYGSSSENLIRFFRQNGVFLNREYTNQQIGILYNHPQHIDLLKTPYKILYTGFESDKMPEEWRELLPRFNEVWVFSKWCGEVMEKQFGIKPKVFPIGINTDEFYLLQRPHAEKFTFLHYDAFKYRKGWDIVLEAFSREFKPEENVQLILKTASEHALPLDYPNVKVLKGSYSFQQLRDLLQQANCFVFPSRGEGYGMTPLEATATGIPAIVPNAHSISDYADNKHFYCLDAKPIKAQYDHYKGDLGNMFQVEIADVQKAMRQEFTKRKFKPTVLANFAKKHSQKQTAKQMCDYLKGKFPKITMQTKTGCPKLSLIVLTYNALEYSIKCFESIVKNTKTDYELIIIDNCSSDGTKQWLQNALQSTFKGKDVTIITNEVNKGVAGGRNQGIALARGEYICFLDNDVEVGENWHKSMTDIMDFNSDVWVVGKGGTNVASFTPLTWCPSPHALGEVDVVAGFCFMFPRKIIPLIGNQYEGLGKFWHEDLEFCGRVKKYGKKIIRNTDIPVVHHEHKSMSKETPNGTAQFSGFFEKGKEVRRRLLDSNVLTIYRMPDDKTFSSYDVIANNIIPVLRDAGFVVLRKEGLHTSSKSFDLCKGFEMEIEGLRMVIAHCENDRPPRHWLKEFELVDIIWTASPHVYNALLSAGVPKHKLMNHACTGFDATTYKFDVASFDYMPIGNPDAFTFFTVGAMQPRKGTDILIKAFCEEFSEKDNVQLIVKNYNYGQTWWVNDLIETYNKNKAKIISIYDTWDDAYLSRFYKTVGRNGAFIVPHRGEGFGMPQCEAMACGCRVGTTNYGGCKTNFDGVAGATLFDYEMKPSTFHNNPAERYYEPEETPMWAEADLTCVRKWLRNVLTEKWDEETAEVSSKYICDNFGFQNRAKKFVEMLKEIVQPPKFGSFE